MRTKLSLFSYIFLVLIFSIFPIFSQIAVDVEPDIDEPYVDIEPKIDLEKFAKCVVYPDIAKREGIQGIVIVKVLIGIEGEIIKSVVEETENVSLNDAVLKAVNECAEFKPAIKNGKPIICWFCIPVTFKLKDETVEINMDIFIEVEKEPEVDFDKLAQCVEYPELARIAGIQGSVNVRVLVGIDGKIIKSVIEDTDSVLLNDAALKAVNECGDFKPAIQKGKPIKCWVIIPVTFRIED